MRRATGDSAALLHQDNLHREWCDLNLPIGVPMNCDEIVRRLNEASEVDHFDKKFQDTCQFASELISDLLKVVETESGKGNGMASSCLLKWPP